MGVLRLEGQAKWWPCFVKEVGVDESVLRGVQWLPFSGQECFYSPTGRCSDILTAISDQSSCKSRQGTFTQRPHLALSSLPSTTTSTPRDWSRFYTRPTWLFLATRLGTEWVPGFGLGPRHNPEIPLEPYIDM